MAILGAKSRLVRHGKAILPSFWAVIAYAMILCMISVGKIGPAVLSSPSPEMFAEPFKPFKPFFGLMTYRYVIGAVMLSKDERHTYQDIDCSIHCEGTMFGVVFLGRWAS